MVDSSTKRPSKLWHRYSIVVAAVTVLLIWWGAATTTEKAGMAFADWPLSQGSLNPDGWLKHLPYFLEHGHRLLASLVGFLTLGLFATAFVRNGKNVIELLVVVIALAAMVVLVAMGGAEKMVVERKEPFWWAATAVGSGVVAWLVYSWRWRQWSLTCKLSALALLLVTFQALMGGIRVTEISDAFAVVHGCLAQGFFCLLIWIILASSERWQQWQPVMSISLRSRLRSMTSFLCSAVFVQLILGALMRHHHRFGLADTGILLTGGAWLPPFDFDQENEILVIMFLHKYWAFLLSVFTVLVFVWATQTLPKGHLLRRLIGGMVIMLGVQITLGICVIIWGKPFWITNFHVINGLLILALSFVTALFAWRGKHGEVSVSLDDQ
ncbi:MAG: COX15/CtaA family protein [Verrucomicrobiales bacterium]|nr:COX15/CtaA family protein [Verrucomicrobiales bacterium]